MDGARGKEITLEMDQRYRELLRRHRANARARDLTLGVMSVVGHGLVGLGRLFRVVGVRREAE